jgi:CHAD domain-containing protein
MCHLELHGEEEARELQRLILRFALWMSGPYWSRPDETKPRKFSKRLLNKLSRRFARAAVHVESPADGQLHALRICAKKLRYSAEFFAALYGKQTPKAYFAALTEVQDVLGRINDVAVAQRLLDDLAVLPELAAHPEAVVMARDNVMQGQARRIGELRKAVRRFEGQGEFWKV